MGFEMFYKPTTADKDAIRECAERCTGYAGATLKLEPGLRVGPGNNGEPHINACLVDSDPDWENSDLASHDTWGSFAKGFDLTHEDIGAVDFYVYQRTHGLLTNVIAYFDRDGLVRVEETERGTVWEREPE